MKSEIISIGDEVLIGQIINTNAAFLGEQLLLAGMPARRTVVVGDEPGEIADAITAAWTRSEVVIATGGLGPTHDDVTRSAITAMFDSDLVFSEAVFADVQAFFERRGRTMLPVHRDQALVPACAEAIRNPVGTAPGFHIRRDGKHLFVLPGVPDEMKVMTTSHIMPLLRSICDTRIAVRTLQTTGIPESNLADLLGAPDSLPDGVSLAFLPSTYGIRLRISARDTRQGEAEELCRTASALIAAKAGDFIFGESTTTLAEVVGALLRDRGLRLAVAESCTGGTLAAMLTDVPGSSDYFNRGVVTYSNESKIDILRVDESILLSHGAVSPLVAMMMAENVRKSAGVDFGLSTTGIAGPGGATAQKPVGVVWVGFSSSDTSFACKYLFGEDRIRTRQRASQAALDLLRRHLLGFPRSSHIVSETVILT
jgi:nicotinamide-nucleotide amidase